AAHGDAALHARYYAHRQKVALSDVQEEQRFMYALALFRDERAIAANVTALLDGSIRDQDVMLLLRELMRVPAGRPAYSRAIRERWARFAPLEGAIRVATQVSTHHQLATEALRAGKHVLVEKPLARTIGEAEALVALADEVNRVLAVGHTFVYNPAVTKVRQILESKQIGSIYYVDSQRVNLGLHQFDINVLWDLGPHDVSIMLYWL